MDNKTAIEDQETEEINPDGTKSAFVYGVDYIDVTGKFPRWYNKNPL